MRLAELSRPGRRPRSLGSALVLVAALLLAIALRWKDPPEGPPPAASSLPAYSSKDDGELLRSLAGGGFGILQDRLREVVDGDTVVLRAGRRLRYLGIDTPERGQAFHDQASERNRTLVLGRDLRVLSPPPPSDRDAYGRTLAAVFVRIPPERGEEGPGTWLLVNRELVRCGLARTYFKDDEALSRALRPALVAAQNAALDARLGLWSRPAALDPAVEVMATRNRFHRPSCRHLRDARSPRRMDRESALRSGRSPCRSCSP